MSFTVTPEQEADDADNIARTLTIELCDFAYVKWEDRERVRVLLRGHFANVNSNALRDVVWGMQEPSP